MQVITQISQLKSQIARFKIQQDSLAFIPTMGNLHEGHLSLIKLGKQQAKRVVISIFVNPLQFGPHEDFQTYPRTLAADLAKLSILKPDLVFTPTVETLYPTPLALQTTVSVPEITKNYCGASRPGFFTGIATILLKLFHLIEPNVVVLGEKDFQQLCAVRKMVVDLCLPIQVIGAPIVRETSGLALSSRNQYLSPTEQQIAPKIFQSLSATKAAILAADNLTAAALRSLEEEAKSTLTNIGLQMDYFQIANLHDLSLAQKKSSELIILTAAYLGRTRLIDNLQIGHKR